MLATVIINATIQKHKFDNGVTIGFVANVGTGNLENMRVVFLTDSIIVANGWGCDPFGSAGRGIYPPLRSSLRADPFP
jgi:hypothetical protein